MWTIRIKTMTAVNDTVVMNIDPLGSVNDLKSRVSTETGVAKERQRLIFQGKVLKNEKSIAFYKIEDGVTIHLVERPVEDDANADTGGSSSSLHPSSSSTRFGASNHGSGRRVLSSPTRLPGNTPLTRLHVAGLPVVMLGSLGGGGAGGSSFSSSTAAESILGSIFMDLASGFEEGIGSAATFRGRSHTNPSGANSTRVTPVDLVGAPSWPHQSPARDAARRSLVQSLNQVYQDLSQAREPRLRTNTSRRLFELASSLQLSREHAHQSDEFLDDCNNAADVSVSPESILSTLTGLTRSVQVMDSLLHECRAMRDEGPPNGEQRASLVRDIFATVRVLLVLAASLAGVPPESLDIDTSERATASSSSSSSSPTPRRILRSSSSASSQSETSRSNSYPRSFAARLVNFFRDSWNDSEEEGNGDDNEDNEEEDDEDARAGMSEAISEAMNEAINEAMSQLIGNFSASSGPDIRSRQRQPSGNEHRARGRRPQPRGHSSSSPPSPPASSTSDAGPSHTRRKRTRGAKQEDRDEEDDSRRTATDATPSDTDAHDSKQGEAKSKRKKKR